MRFHFMILKNLILLLLTLVFGHLTLVSFAQGDLHFTKHYTQKDGLTNTAVSLIYEDSRGFLWMGTKEGLNRFDGLHFKTFFHNKNSANSLPHNAVLDFLEYQPGLLLIATPNGLTVFNSLIGKFEQERIGHVPFTENFSSQYISLFQDKEGNVWVNQSGEIDVLDQHLNYLYRLTDLDWAKALKGSIVAFEDWLFDSKGNLWLPTDTSGIQIINFKNKIIYNRDYNPQNLLFLKFKYIRALAMDEKNHTLWIAPWGNGLYKYDLLDGTMKHQDFGYPPGTEISSINSIQIADNGKILCSTNGYFFEVDPLSMVFTKIEPPRELNIADPDHLIHTNIIVKAKGHGYWIGAAEGLFKLEEEKQEHIISLPGTIGSACTDMISSSDGMIYSIYENGLLIETDRNKTSFKSYPVPLDMDHFSLTHLCEDKMHQIWIGTTNGLLLFDPVSKQFQRPTFQGEISNLRHINALFCDLKGDMWIGTREPFQLFRFIMKEHRMERIENELLDKISNVGSIGRISSMVEDHKGYLWMSSSVGGGILRFDRIHNEWKRFPMDEENLLFLSKKGVITLYPDAYSNLWLATTTGDGLIRYNYESNQLEKFNREEGILSDFVFQICPDGDKLWLTTEYGYSEFNVRNHTIISHDWIDISFPLVAVIDTFRKDLVISAKGKQVFISTDEEENKYPPPVPVVDAIYVNNREQFINPHTTHLSLKYDQKNITINFTTAYFSDADKVHFAYILEGADKEWQYPKGTRTAQYASLSPGAYVFKMKAADPGGNWGNAVDAFSFTVVPPFWKALWFLISLAILIMATIAWIVKKRVTTIRYEAGLKQRIVETEMMALRAQMNPHFIFNSLNSIDGLIHNDDKYHATLYLNKFAKLIRNILDSSRQNTITVTKDLETLKLYIELEQFRNENKFTSEITVDPAILREDVRVPPLIIQPYVENAILHGLRNRSDDKGHLSISLSRENGTLHYVIEDNGVGRGHAINGYADDKVSYGLQMSSDRIKLFNHEAQASVVITDLMEQGNPAGTKVEIRLKAN